jgi:hypothetical protein
MKVEHSKPDRKKVGKMPGLMLMRSLRARPPVRSGDGTIGTCAGF